MFNAWCYSSDRSALQVGMIVADSSHSGTGAPGLIYGHVGIYVGGGIVMSNEGAITSKSLDSFISFLWALALACGRARGPLGFGARHTGLVV